MDTPTASQAKIRDHESLSLLVIAPAGCGKTESLALRAQGLLNSKAVESPRRILVTTFSNRARDNIRDRLRTHLTTKQLRECVTVVNFHGLSSRIFRAHASVIGMDPDMIMPEGDWVSDQCRSRRLDFAQAVQVQAQLRSIKLQGLDDAATESALKNSRHHVALEIERQRKSERRLTYDDLPRLAEVILRNDRVAGLYRNHFGAIIVDEFQDLTPQQLRIINRIGYGRTTYAGDLAQGIYSFAGADPVRILSVIENECDYKVQFSESHRSSPAVLMAVNSLTHLTNGHDLTSAHPESWPGGGLAGGVRFSNVESEASWIVGLCETILEGAPGQRIGVIARTRARRRFVDEYSGTSGYPVYRWEDGVLNSETARVVREMLNRLNPSDFHSASDRVQFLREAADIESIFDPDDRTALFDALRWCHDLLVEDISPDLIKSRIRIGNHNTLLDQSGIHLLTGHAGKGQQFDWIFVVGLEEDALPDFRQKRSQDTLREEARILAVMMSRARHGVVLSMSNSVPTRYGNPKKYEPSQFWSALKGGGLFRRDMIEERIQNFDWSSIAG